MQCYRNIIIVEKYVENFQLFNNVNRVFNTSLFFKNALKKSIQNKNLYILGCFHRKNRAKSSCRLGFARFLLWIDFFEKIYTFQKRAKWRLQQGFARFYFWVNRFSKINLYTLNDDISSFKPDWIDCIDFFQNLIYKTQKHIYVKNNKHCWKLLYCGKLYKIP